MTLPPVYSCALLSLNALVITDTLAEAQGGEVFPSYSFSCDEWPSHGCAAG